MLGAHDLEEFYELQDEGRKSPHEAHAAMTDQPRHRCPLCAAAGTARRLSFLTLGRGRRAA